MIRSFRDVESAKLFRDEPRKRFQAVERTARRKPYQLDQARSLIDLSSLPGNRREALRGARAGQYSIRINDQFRICFTWSEGDAYKVEIVDYH